MTALERLNETTRKLQEAKAAHAVSDANGDFLFNYDNYETTRAAVAELESELRINWIRLQLELGMEVSIASVMA
jgi:hypothetical protein